MESIFSAFIKRFPVDLQNRLNAAFKNSKEISPLKKYREGTCYIFKVLLEEKSYDNELLLEIASLVCYLTPKMKADKEFIELLKKIDHPYIKIFVAYYEEEPTNYNETLQKIENLTKELETRSNYTDEMASQILEIHSWIYGQRGDIEKVKLVSKKAKNRIIGTDNLIEQLGLQDSIINSIWWFLQAGLESYAKDLIIFLEPFVIKYRNYRSHTEFLNAKSVIKFFFGYTNESILLYQEIIKIHNDNHDYYRESIAMGNLAEVFSTTGKIQKACALMEKAVKQYKESTGKWPYLFLADLGNIYYLLGNSKAEEKFLLGYEIQKNEVSMHKAYVLFELLHFYLRSENLEKSKELLIKFKELQKELQIPLVKARLDYLSGFYEIQQNNISTAINYFKDALEISQSAKTIELILACNIQLVFAVLQSFKLSEKQEELNASLNYLDTVIQLAKENQHKIIEATGLIIRAVLNSVKSNYLQAVNDIEQAKVVGKDIDYPRWKRDFVKIEERIMSISEIKEKSIDKSVIEFLVPQFKSLLSFKLSQKQKRSSEILGILIINDGGVPVFTKLKETIKADDTILSGLLLAISKIATDIFESGDSERGRLKDVLYENFSITLQEIDNGLVAVIASELTAEIRMSSINIADKVRELPVNEAIISSKMRKNIGQIISQIGF